MSQNLYLRQGMFGQWTVQLENSSDMPVTSYTSADPLTAIVWVGDDRAALDTPTATWIDASTGTIQLTIQESDTATLDIGKYKASIEITHLGVTVEGWRGWIDVQQSPGTTNYPIPYCSYLDMLRLAPHLEKEEGFVAGGGFLGSRVLAREWLDQILWYRSPGSRWMPTIFRQYISWSIPDPYIIEQLRLNKLIISPKIKNITAMKAISIVYKTFLSPTDKGHSEYQRMGYQMSHQADNAVRGLIAELDLNSDGKPDYWIDCSYMSMRFPRG
jgi:hypothetical protein